MAAPTKRSIPLNNLLIDLQNPRYDLRINQREALTTIAHDQGMKLVNLAEDIVDRGLNPSDLPMVTPADQPDLFVVLEGNRRVAALKLLCSLSLINSLGLSQTLLKRYKNLQERAQGSLPTELECVVLSREDANDWIRLKHTGENEGVGVVSWDGRARQRFRGTSPALQAIELVESRNYLDDETKARLPKIAITNIERILGTPDARALLGVDVKNDKLILNPPEDDALGRLAAVVEDVAQRRVRVTALDTKEQRVAYARRVASLPIPRPKTPTAGSQPAPLPLSGSRAAAHIAAQRRTLIPKQFKVRIPQTRVNRIFAELQKLNIDSYVNSCAVLLRVFVELSVDDYAHRHRLSLKVITKAKKSTKGPFPARDMTLREKLKSVASSLETRGACTKAELHGVRTLISNREHVISVDTLHAYVHNKDYNPTPADLKANWDNIQLFIERLWNN